MKCRQNKRFIFLKILDEASSCQAQKNQLEISFKIKTPNH